MKRLCACLLCGLVAVACGALPGRGLGLPGAYRGTVKIALIDAFSGAYGSIGTYEQHSLQVEVDHINGLGGLLGYRVEVAAADDELVPQKASALTQEMTGDAEVKLLVGPGSTDAFAAVKPIIAQARIPNCLPSVRADDVIQNAPYTFRTLEGTRLAVDALMQYLHSSNSSITHVGLVQANSTDGHFVDRLLPGEARRSGIDVVATAFAPDPNADQTSIVQQLQAKGAQAVILSSDPLFAARTAMAVEEVGAAGKLQLLGLSELGSALYPNGAGPAAVGTIFAATNQSYRAAIPDTKWPPVFKDFVQRIVDQYGYSSDGSEIQGSAPAADCVLGWARAVEKANTFDGQQVVQAWQTLDLPASETVTGTREAFPGAAHDAVASGGIGVYQWVRDGDRLRLKQLVAPAG